MYVLSVKNMNHLLKVIIQLDPTWTQLFQILEFTLPSQSSWWLETPTKLEVRISSESLK